MIKQYLLNTNEIATVSILPKQKMELNKGLVPQKNCKIFQISCHIESCGTSMKH